MQYFYGIVLQVVGALFTLINSFSKLSWRSIEKETIPIRYNNEFETIKEMDEIYGIKLFLKLGSSIKDKKSLEIIKKIFIDRVAFLYISFGIVLSAFSSYNKNSLNENWYKPIIFFLFILLVTYMILIIEIKFCSWKIEREHLIGKIVSIISIDKKVCLDEILKNYKMSKKIFNEMQTKKVIETISENETYEYTKEKYNINPDNLKKHYKRELKNNNNNECD